MYKNIAQKLFFSVAAFALLISPSYSDVAVDGTDQYCDNATLEGYSGSVNLRAEWEANTINISWYDGNTEITPTNAAAGECTYDDGITLPANTLTKEGYTFDGWKIKITWFDITTTNMTANDTFKFSISASGTFKVECGDNGVLSGNGVGQDGITITRAGTTMEQYTCTYPNAGSHTIHMTGRATGYNSTIVTSGTGAYAAIGFSTDNMSGNTPTKIASISGSLGGIFPTLNNGSNNLAYQPRFAYTFYGCTGLTSLPSTLFNGVFGAASYMFCATFYNCTGLTSLPSNLFHGISGAANSMFNGTFFGCSGLTSLPTGLFNGISGAAESMFAYTFQSCTRLTTLPSDLFNGMSGAAEKMFQQTFCYCTGLTSLPSGLFDGLSGNAYGMFPFTFYGCTALKTVPYNLFAGLSGTPADDIFWRTFYNDTALDTFVLADGSTVNYIPDGFFGSITGNASAMNNVFNGNTKIASSCPANMTQAYADYASNLNGRVACK